MLSDTEINLIRLINEINHKWRIKNNLNYENMITDVYSNEILHSMFLEDDNSYKTTKRIQENNVQIFIHVILIQIRL